MLSSLNTPEITRLALLIGVYTAIYYKNKYGIIPGGLVIPGFLTILFILSPIWFASLIALAFAIYYLYNRFLKRANYKNRTPMYLLALISIVLAYPLANLYIYLGWMEQSIDSLTGALIPAIIAYQWTKQDMWKVSKGIAITFALTALYLGVIYLAGSYLGISFNEIRPAYAGKEWIYFEYPTAQFCLALVLGYLIYRRTLVRSGGYLVAPAAAALLLRPLSAVLLVLGCMVVYLLVWLICRYSLTIGLNRYGLALFISTIYVWAVELLFLHLDPTLLPFQGSNLFVIVVIISYVNDTILYWKRGVAANMVFLLTVAIAVHFGTNFLAKLLV